MKLKLYRTNGFKTYFICMKTNRKRFIRILYRCNGN